MKKILAYFSKKEWTLYPVHDDFFYEFLNFICINFYAFYLFYSHPLKSRDRQPLTKAQHFINNHIKEMGSRLQIVQALLLK